MMSCGVSVERGVAGYLFFGSICSYVSCVGVVTRGRGEGRVKGVGSFAVMLS